MLRIRFLRQIFIFMQIQDQEINNVEWG